MTGITQNASPKTLALPSITEYSISNTQSTLASIMLDEELQCNGCIDSSIIVDNRCMICELEFHSKCLDNQTEICHSCIGLQCQDNEIEETSVKEINDTLTQKHSRQIPKEESPSKSSKVDEQHTFVKEIWLKDDIAKSDKPRQKAKDKDGSEIDISAKMKELKQLEQKLKKKEEQIKIKESMINEDMKEKTKLLDRLHRSEIRNMELENTIKTLYTRIDSMQIRPCPENTPQTDVNKHADSNDELLKGMRERVTKYLLRKIDNEIGELEKSQIKPNESTDAVTSTKLENADNNNVNNMTSNTHTRDSKSMQSKDNKVEENENCEWKNDVENDSGTQPNRRYYTPYQQHKSSVSYNACCKDVTGQPIYYRAHKYKRSVFYARPASADHGIGKGCTRCTCCI